MLITSTREEDITITLLHTGNGVDGSCKLT